jgi:hypothetical protein
MCPEVAVSLNCGARPPWFSKRACFENLLQTKDENTTISVLFDGDLSKHWITNYPVEIVEVKAGTGDFSFLEQIQFAKKKGFSDDSILYILEDDYKHKSNWPTVLREAFNHPKPPKYASLFDHPDKYEYPEYEDLMAKLYVTPSCHWRTTPSTTNTFASLYKTFKEDYRIHEYFLNYDHVKFCRLADGGRFLWTCIPGWSIHQGKDEEEFLSFK